LHAGVPVAALPSSSTVPAGRVAHRQTVTTCRQIGSCFFVSHMLAHSGFTIASKAIIVTNAGDKCSACKLSCLALLCIRIHAGNMDIATEVSDVTCTTNGRCRHGLSPIRQWTHQRDTNSCPCKCKPGETRTWAHRNSATRDAIARTPAS
jgi:hypothetical protein